MDEPPRKRRKTASPGARERESSPLKKPPRRPSFASPTKASISRFNPSLLPPRPTSSGSGTLRPNSRGDILSRGKQARAFILGDSEKQGREEEAAQDSEDQAVAGAKQQRPPKTQDVTSRNPRTTTRARASIPRRDLLEEELELPSSPSRAAAQQDTPRRGVLFSSPSKRPPRVKDTAGQSPLKPRQQDGREARSADAIADVEQAQEDAQKKEPDPELEKKKREKDTLLHELQGLERDVAECTDHITKLRDLPSTKTFNSSEQDELISFIERISSIDAEVERQTPSVSDLLCSFLPFTAQAIAPPPTEGESKRPRSHQPLELEDPLPYLEMFTSFKFSSHITIPESTNPDHKTSELQQHAIEIMGPQKLLMGAVDATVDSLTQEVIELNVSRISGWAERELGQFIRQKALKKDISTVCWAIGSYWEISKRRAQYWHKCETAFEHLIAGRTSDDTENVTQITTKNEKNVSRKDLLRQLGRDVLFLESKHVLLKIGWTIGFDWTGEAESSISIEPAFPRVWNEADSTNSLKQVPQVFNSWVESIGVFEATKKIVVLLFPNS